MCISKNLYDYVFSLQAIGPELTFYNTSKDVAKSLLLSNKLLHTQLDAFCRSFSFQLIMCWLEIVLSGLSTIYFPAFHNVMAPAGCFPSVAVLMCLILVPSSQMLKINRCLLK